MVGSRIRQEINTSHLMHLNMLRMGKVKNNRSVLYSLSRWSPFLNNNYNGFFLLIVTRALWFSSKITDLKVALRFAGVALSINLSSCMSLLHESA